MAAVRTDKSNAVIPKYWEDTEYRPSVFIFFRPHYVF